MCYASQHQCLPFKPTNPRKTNLKPNQPNTDFYKDGAKSVDPKATVTTNVYRLSRNPNHFGDQLRYLSFALLAGGAPAAFFPLAWTVLINLAGRKERDERISQRGPEGAKYVASTPAVVPWRLFF